MNFEQKRAEYINGTFTAHDLAASIARDFEERGYDITPEDFGITSKLSNGSKVYYDVSYAFGRLVANDEDGFTDAIHHIEESLSSALGIRSHTIQEFVSAIENSFPEIAKRAFGDAKFVYNSDSNTAYLDGFTLEDGSRISPILRDFDKIFKDALNGNFEEVTSHIATTFAKNAMEIAFSPERSSITSRLETFDGIKDNLYSILVSRKTAQNADALYRDFVEDIVENMAVIFDNGDVVRITENLASSWGEDFDRLWETARNNTVNSFLQIEPVPLFNIIAPIVPEELTSEMGTFAEQRPSPLVIMPALPGGTYGASILLSSDDVERVISKFDGPVAIVPSSVHELIFQPIELGMTLDDLKDILAEMSVCADTPRDILCNIPLVYKNGELRYATEEDFNFEASFEEEDNHEIE